MTELMASPRMMCTDSSTTALTITIKRKLTKAWRAVVSGAAVRAVFIFTRTPTPRVRPAIDYISRPTRARLTTKPLPVAALFKENIRLVRFLFI